MVDGLYIEGISVPTNRRDLIKKFMNITVAKEIAFPNKTFLKTQPITRGTVRLLGQWTVRRLLIIGVDMSGLRMSCIIKKLV